MKNFKQNSKILLIAIGVVFVWRGIWGITDLYLFPNNPTLSLIVSIMIGLVILYTNDKKIDELDLRNK